MTEDCMIHYETIRHTRMERFRDWRRNKLRGFEEGWADAFGHVRQRDWAETEAEVVSCRAARQYYSLGGNYRLSAPVSSGWAVTFTYLVNGRCYDGVFTSPDRVHAGDTFSIGYNPEYPEENNTIDSEPKYLSGSIEWIYDAFLILILFALAVASILFKIKYDVFDDPEYGRTDSSFDGYESAAAPSPAPCHSARTADAA